MAGRIIGRTACPECGFGKAHVRESERCLYRFCPECSSQYHARTPAQRALLTEKTTLIDAPTSTPTGPEALEVSGAATVVAPTPSPTPAPPAAPVKRRGLFG